MPLQCRSDQHAVRAWRRSRRVTAGQGHDCQATKILPTQGAPSSPRRPIGKTLNARWAGSVTASQQTNAKQQKVSNHASISPVCADQPLALLLLLQQQVHHVGGQLDLAGQAEDLEAHLVTVRLDCHNRLGHCVDGL